MNAMLKAMMGEAYEALRRDFDPDDLFNRAMGFKHPHAVKLPAWEQFEEADRVLEELRRDGQIGRFF